MKTKTVGQKDRARRLTLALGLGLALGGGALGPAGAGKAATRRTDAPLKQILQGGGYDGLGGLNHNRALRRIS
jgi:hypothetical protein